MAAFKTGARAAKRSPKNTVVPYDVHLLVPTLSSVSSFMVPTFSFVELELAVSEWTPPNKYRPRWDG